MSRIILEKTIREELKKINDTIDMKILMGLPYKRESLRHRFLLYRLSDLHRVSKFNSTWLQRSINTIATFVL